MTSPAAAPPLPAPPPDPRTSAGRLSRDALVYGVGFVVARAAGFIMLPIYTRFLTPEDYAVLQLLMMSLDVATILLAGGVTAGVTRFYFKRDTPRDAHSVVVAAWLMMFAFNLVGALGLSAAAPAIAEHVLEDPAAAPLVVLIAIAYALDPCLTIPLLLMQIRQRAALYTVASVVRLVSQLGLNIFFVVVLREGVAGIIWSTILTYVGLSLPLMAWMLRRTGFPLVRAAFVDLVRFGLPYKLTDAGNFILTYADRYFLLASHSLFVTGVYSLAYQFGFVVLYLSATPFMLAWNPQRFRLAREPREVREPAYNRGFLMFSVLLVSTCVGVSVFVAPTLEIIANPEYHEAARIAPILVAAYAMQGWMQVFELQIQVSERTAWATAATFIAVGAILALYALLIPPFGAYGAAIATLVAFAARTVAFYAFGQHLWPVRWRLRAHLVLALYGTATAGAYWIVAPTDLGPQLALATGLSATFAALVWRGGVLTAADRAVLVGFARERAASLRALLHRREAA